MSNSLRTYNPKVSQRLTTQLVGLPPRQSLGVLAHLALKALTLLQQEQLALPDIQREQLWYVEGTIAFPQLRITWDSAWVEQGAWSRLDVLRPLLEEMEYIYFPAARYVVTERLDPDEWARARLPLIREMEAKPGVYPKYYYQEARDWAVIRALAATEEQYFQARACWPGITREALIEAMTTQNQRVFHRLLRAAEAPLVQSLRARPDWIGKELNWSLDR